ncbi:hypothetical protein SH668x_000599 [Planctomicrobium sp. SH668]|uniref:hypothetical protein n=1 Tax=Planctomicrobium sp. SH668 TaxID=3448126 RepID=UPI003F5AF3A1
MEEERHCGMVRSITRNVICFMAALMLLGLMVCAVEVALRAKRLRSNWKAESHITHLNELIQPNNTTWIDVKPLIDLHRRSSNQPSIQIQTNELGIRGASVSVPKPNGVFRVICIGSDNVFGSTLAENETLSTRLARTLNLQSNRQVEVINAGCPNAGPLVNLLRYRNHLATLQADVVLLCLSEEDLSYDQDVRGGLHLDESKNPAYASHPALCGQGVDMLDRICEEFVTLDYLFTWAGRVTGMNVNSTPIHAAPVRQSMHRDLAALVPLSRIVQGNSCQLIISVCPSAWSVDRSRNSIDQNGSSFAEEVRRFLKEWNLEQVPVQDGLVDFSKSNDPRIYFSPATGGLSFSGNELYAQQISSFLIQSFPVLGGGRSPEMQANTVPTSFAQPESSSQRQYEPLRPVSR